MCRLYYRTDEHQRHNQIGFFYISRSKDGNPMVSAPANGMLEREKILCLWNPNALAQNVMSSKGMLGTCTIICDNLTFNYVSIASSLTCNAYRI